MVKWLKDLLGIRQKRCTTEVFELGPDDVLIDFLFEELRPYVGGGYNITVDIDETEVSITWCRAC